MHSDSPNDSWAIRFAQFVQRFGTLKLSILFVVFSLVFTLGGSYVIRVSMGSAVQPDDFISAVILTMLSAPWVLYFFSELIKQLENSRTNLKEVVSQLERLREEDVFLNREFRTNLNKKRKPAACLPCFVLLLMPRQILFTTEMKKGALRAVTV